MERSTISQDVMVLRGKVCEAEHYALYKLGKWHTGTGIAVLILLLDKSYFIIKHVHKNQNMCFVQIWVQK